MSTMRPAGPPLDKWTRHAPTLSRLASKLGSPLFRAFLDSRPERFAWPAVVIALSDVVLRRFVPRGHALQYGSRVLVMAVLWGALGGLLGILLRQARRHRGFFAAALALALS